MKMQDVQINSSFDLASIIELKTRNILKNQEIKKARRCDLRIIRGLAISDRSLDPIAEEKRSITIKKAFQKHKNFLEAIVLVIQSTFDENIGSVCVCVFIYNNHTWVGTRISRLGGMG
jgi:hypothetical protein